MWAAPSIADGIIYTGNNAGAVTAFGPARYASASPATRSQLPEQLHLPGHRITDPRRQ